MKDISIIDLLRAVLSKLWLIVLVAVSFAIIAFVYATSFATPIYAATSSILVSNGGIVSGDSVTINNDRHTIQNGDLAASTSIKTTCIDLLLTSNMYDVVHEKLPNNLSYTAGQLKGMVSITERSEESLLLDIKVSGSDRNDIILIANTFAEVAPDYISEKLTTSYAKPVETAKGTVKVKPNITMLTFAAFVVGALLVAAPLVLIFINDKTIKGEEDFAATYDISILGIVPDFVQSTKGGKY